MATNVVLFYAYILLANGKLDGIHITSTPTIPPQTYAEVGVFNDYEQARLAAREMVKKWA